ncbi:MAG: acetyltransferase [Acidimicrobiales bacterium]
MSGRPLVIFGATSQARLAAHFFATDSDFKPVAYTVDRQYADGDSFEGLPLVPFDEVTDRYPPAEHDLFVALGYSEMNKIRAAKYTEAKAMGYRLPSYVSSRCTYLSDHEPGDNCLILEDNTIQPFVRIGSNVTLWSGNHIGHDSTIGDHVFIASQAVVSGFVTIEDYCFIGVNATLRDDITIRMGSLIGAGAAIMADTEERGVYVPPRATLLDRKSDEIKIS